MSLKQQLFALGVAALAFGLGCENIKFRGTTEDPQSSKSSQQKVVVEQKAGRERGRNAQQAEEPLGPEEEGTGFDFSFSNSAADSGGQHEHSGLGEEAAADTVLKLVEESVAYGPTLVVWLVDRSPSAQTLFRGLLDRIGQQYAELGDSESFASASSDSPPLLTALCLCGEEVDLLLDPPTADPAQLLDAFDRLEVDSSGKEALFTAVQRCLQRYLSYRTELRREVLFVMITDEAGDDAQLAEEVIPAARRYGIPIYVMGVPAPFGRLAATDQAVEAPSDYRAGSQWLPIRQGPESLFPQRINLGFTSGAVDLERIDSGFGPFALEHLCRASGGQFLALRPHRGSSSTSSDQWPATAAYSFRPEVMRRYAPEYVSPEVYRSMLEENAARRALHEASQIPDVEVLASPRLEFEKRSEADLARQLSTAQRAAARLEPGIHHLYDTLEQGEADRGKLKSPRWQAGYDLAMGRASAAKARVDGYNAMLAALKRGKNFEQESSTTWVLRPAETIEVSSALGRLVEQANSYLRRVVDQYPDTPWAVIAQRELETPSGWQWTEK